MILSILKGIGILLLVLLGIIIFILFVLLFVPICYRVDGKYDQTLNGKVSVTWLPLILKAQVTFYDNRPEYVVRLFGGVILTNTDRKISWLGRKLFSNEDKEIPDDNPSDQIIDQKEQSSENNKETSTMQPPEVREKEKTSETDTEISKRIADTQQKKTVISHPKKKKTFYQKIKQKWTTFKTKLHDLILKIKKLKHKKDALTKVLHSKQFKRAKTDMMRYIKEILRIIKPDRMEGYIHFGMEDPATTGEITGVLATLPFAYNEKFLIYPDFEKKCLDAEGKGKGKIFLISILILLLKIVFNKNIIKVTKKVQTILQA